VSGIIDRLLREIRLAGTVSDVRVGVHWTAVVAETAAGPRAGLAATVTEGARSGLSPTRGHGAPSVGAAGKLLGKPAAELAGLARSDSPVERSIGFAALNALLEVSEPGTDRNAEDVIVERGSGKRVAIVGHFPFVDRIREVAAACWVLELNPAEDDLPAARAAEIIPRADVVAITGMTLVNETFEELARLPSRDAFVMVLGPSTPLSPVLYEYGVDALSGTMVVDIPLVLAAVSQGATFRQIAGRRLVTMLRR